MAHCSAPDNATQRSISYWFSSPWQVAVCSFLICGLSYRIFRVLYRKPFYLRLKHFITMLKSSNWPSWLNPFRFSVNYYLVLNPLCYFCPFPRQFGIPVFLWPFIFTSSEHFYIVFFFVFFVYFSLLIHCWLIWVFLFLTAIVFSSYCVLYRTITFSFMLYCGHFYCLCYRFSQCLHHTYDQTVPFFLVFLTFLFIY